MTCSQCALWGHLSPKLYPNGLFGRYALPTDNTGLCPYELELGIMFAKPKWLQGDCRFAVADRIPDPAVEWKDGMRCKPKVDGFRCHAMRPSAAGFPIVKGDDFCALFTELGTNAQPLRHLVSETVQRKEVEE